MGWRPALAGKLPGFFGDRPGERIYDAFYSESPAFIAGADANRFKEERAMLA